MESPHQSSTSGDPLNLRAVVVIDHNLGELCPYDNELMNPLDAMHENRGALAKPISESPRRPK